MKNDVKMPEILFTIARKIVGRHPEPVFITNMTDGQEIYINGEVLEGKQQRILLPMDKISITKSRAFCTFHDFNYPTLGAEEYPREISTKYFVEEYELGVGVSGFVTTAHDVKSCKKFAIKVVQKENPYEDYVKEATFTNRAKHSAVIELYKTIESSSHVYFILEILEESLQQRIERSGIGLEEKEIKVLFYQLACGVKHLHSLKMVHRDLKAKNTMLQSNETFTRLKIIDFGQSATDSNLKSISGTPLQVFLLFHYFYTRNGYIGACHVFYCRLPPTSC